MEHIDDMIPANDFCNSHRVSYTFIEGLFQAGIIEVVMREEQPYLQTAQLPGLEKLVRFHTELDINLEGIEAIAHLLDQLHETQQQLQQLQQRLRLYEHLYNRL